MRLYRTLSSLILLSLQTIVPTVDHAVLQRQLKPPSCLDESIHSPEHARWALDIGACRVINI